MLSSKHILIRNTEQENTLTILKRHLEKYCAERWRPPAYLVSNISSLQREASVTSRGLRQYAPRGALSRPGFENANIAISCENTSIFNPESHVVCGERGLSTMRRSNPGTLPGHIERFAAYRQAGE